MADATPTPFRQLGKNVRICRLDANSAAGVPALFREVYGEGYPMRRFYDPDDLLAADASGESVSCVALDKEDKVIAHLALYRSAPWPKLYELGAGLTARKYRSRGHIVRMTDYVLEALVPQIGAQALFVETVCNHITTQKISRRKGLRETAIEVDLMPAQAYTTEASADGRVSTVLAFRSQVSREQTLAIPSHLLDFIQTCYDGYPEPRQFISDSTPATGLTSGDSMTFMEAGVMRLFVRHPGTDFNDWLAEHIASADAANIAVVQVFLNLVNPGINVAVAVLESAGFFPCGVAPRWFDDDALVMQRHAAPPGFEAIQLMDDRLYGLRDDIAGAWRRVASSMPSSQS